MEEPYDLDNMFVGFEKPDQINYVDGFHLDSSYLLEINGSSYPHTMHDLIQSSKCNPAILEHSGTCLKVEEIQLPLMVMLGSCNSSKVP